MDCDPPRIQSESCLLFSGNLATKRPVNAHILFVDDEAPIREMLSLYFRKKGLQVTTAVTASEATKLVAEIPFSLAILDVELAGENGLDLLSSFKRNYTNLPVIIFTGLDGDEGLMEQARAPGANGFLATTETSGR